MWPDDTSSGDGWGLSVGPQTDGTYNSPVLAAQPVDAGGGAPANYGQSVLDVFRLGVGAWQTQQQQQNLLNYQRYEATAGALTQQGTPSATATTARRLSPLVLIVGIGLAVLLAAKA